MIRTLRVAALMALATIVGGACNAGPEPVSSGTAAPAFTLPSAAGTKVSLADFVGSKPVLLYFSMGPG